MLNPEATRAYFTPLTPKVERASQLASTALYKRRMVDKKSFTMSTTTSSQRTMSWCVGGHAITVNTAERKNERRTIDDRKITRVSCVAKS